MEKFECLPKFKRLPISKIDHCLGVLREVVFGCDSEMEYLINYRKSEFRSYYRLAIDVYCVVIFQRIKEGKLHRWDFDPLDYSHPGQKGISLSSDWQPPSHWRRADKCRLLYDLVGCFRKQCHNLVDELITKSEEAQNFQDIREMKFQALDAGVLVDGSSCLSHCHSVLNSKKVL